MRKSMHLAAAAVSCLVAGSAQAHVSLSVSEVPAGATTLIGFGPGHGCSGSPTVAMRIQIPAGLSSVKPVAKPGWDINIVHDAEGAVTEIDFTGGNLPDEWYDQFWIRAKIDAETPAGTHIWFPIVQECVEGANHWVDTPVDGQPEPDEPAPGFTVTEPLSAADGS